MMTASIKHTWIGMASTLFVLTLGAVASAQTMSDYKAEPEFIAEAVPPNIVMLMDNSGSMNSLAYGILNSGGSPVTPFDPNKDYNGIFDPLKCYQYSSSGDKFLPSSSTLGSVGATCTDASYPWHGNLLNYATVRRLDVIKWVMVGGNCNSGTLGAGTCSQLKGQDQFVSTACCRDVSAIVTKSNATNRMPSGNLPSGGGSTSIYFHQKASDTNHRGYFCVDDDATMTTNNNCNGGDGDSYSETKWGIKADVSVSPVGVVQSIGKKARMGMMQFHDGSSGIDGGKLTAEPGAIPGPNGVQEDMVNAVSSMIATASTPLAESLYELTRYFAQAPPVYANSDYTDTVDTKDPYWFKSGGQGWANPAQLVKCCKSFVIIFTDGSPTNDTRIPPSMQDAAHSALGHESGNETGHHDVCSAYWGGAGNDSCVASGRHYLDDVAYYAHTKDLRPDTGDLVGLGAKSGSSIVDGDFTPPNETRYRLPGKQNLNIYTFLAFGSGQNILQSTAKAGGFEDSNGNGIPDNGQTVAGPCVAGGPCEYDKYNNLSGVAGPDGVPDNYFFSNDADDLKDRILATINSILQRSASGTAASVLANSSTGEGALYQAFFYPRTTEGSKDVAWAGYVKGFFLDAFGNMREDSSGPDGTGGPDGRLVYQHDLIMKMEYDSSLNKVVIKRYRDSNGDGKADSTTPISGTAPDIRQVEGLWEAGDKLAVKDASARKLYTWVDKNNDGVVDTNERIEFKKGGAEETDLTPYLYPGLVGGFTINPADLIDFIRGCEPSTCTNQSNFRYRTLTSSAGQKVWKLGDPVHSTPTVVAAPRERYDVLYGDGSYSKFFKDYRCRRNVIYVGANDGMLHAFNGGFYNRGDNSGTPEVEHGYFTLNRASTCPGLPTTVTNTPVLGDELWGFIPMQALPHLRWLADPKYSHVYYIDAKPKVTDVRIFCTSPASLSPCIDGQSSVTHTDGWGTILIGAFRFGGSCGNATCASGAGAVKKMSYTHAGFGTGTTREFLSAYFVLDITDPEQPPKLLWSFSETDLGFTTSYPAVARVKPSCSTLNCKVDPTDAQWMALFGSGPTNYNVDTIAQSAKMYAVNLINGPGVFTGGANKYAAANVKKMVVESSGSSIMGDMATVDLELDYRVNVSYAGSTIGTGTPWTGKLYRLSTPCPGAPCWDSWGISDGAGGRSPTVVVDNFVSSAGTLSVGPVSAGVTVTKDDANQVWVFFGTGRYWSVADRTLSQQEYFLGVKDSVHSGTCTEATLAGCREQDLVDVSSARVCLNCANPVSGVSEGSATPTTLLGTTTTSLQGLVATKRGWFTKLPLPGTSALPAAPLERVLVTPTLAGGIVFFPTFVPKDEICVALGNGYLYALFYQTGSAHTVPVLGTTTDVSGNKISDRNMFLGEGQVSQLGVHIGAQGSGAVGGGCAGNMSVIGQTSTGAIVGSCTNTQGAWSKYISWKDQRD